MQLSYLQNLFWLVYSVPEGYVYHINFPGSDISHPIFQVVKGTPTDLTGLTFQTGTLIAIGSYPSFAAAQAACEADFTAAAPRVVLPVPSTTSPNQPTQPVT